MAAAVAAAVAAAAAVPAGRLGISPRVDERAPLPKGSGAFVRPQLTSAGPVIQPPARHFDAIDRADAVVVDFGEIVRQGS